MATTLKKYLVKTGGDKKAKRKSRSNSKSRSKIKNAKEFEKMFRVFVVNKRPPNKNDILTDEEIDRYFELLGDDKNNTFTEQGHIFVCVLLKQLHNDNSINEVFDAMAGFKTFTKKQKQEIKRDLDILFPKYSSKVTELHGGGFVSFAMKSFSFIYFVMQTTYYAVYWNYIQDQFYKMDTNLKKQTSQINTMLSLSANTSIPEIYDLMIPNQDPKKTYTYFLLENVVYPHLIKKDIQKSQDFQNETVQIIQYFSVLSNSFYDNVIDPSSKFTNQFSHIAITKENQFKERKFISNINEQIEQYEKVSKSSYDDLFTDSKHYTKKEHDQNLKNMNKFKDLLKKITVIVNTPRGDYLKDDPKLKKLITNIETIGKMFENQGKELEERLDNLSQSTDIALISEETDGKDVAKQHLNVAKLFQDAMGITTIKKYEKYLGSQLTAIYNGYFAPHMEIFHSIKNSLAYIIKKVGGITATIADITRKMVELQLKGDLTPLLNELPSQFSLLASVYNDLCIIMPGLSWYLGSIFTMLFFFLKKGFDKITPYMVISKKEKKVGKRILINNFLKSSPSIKSPPKSPKKSPPKSPKKSPPKSPQSRKSPPKSSGFGNFQLTAPSYDPVKFKSQ